MQCAGLVVIRVAVRGVRREATIEVPHREVGVAGLGVLVGEAVEDERIVRLFREELFERGDGGHGEVYSGWRGVSAAQLQKHTAPGIIARGC